MSLLLLLTSMLLSTYLHNGGVADAQQLFTIRNITLFIEPSADVTRDTGVTLRCKAFVSSSGQEVLSREYTIYKDNQVVYTKTSSTTEDLLYHLPVARVSNSGKYMCKINITGTVMTSDALKLSVTGLSKPDLILSKSVLGEGEELTARCTAPGETGSIFFYFYDGSKEILDKEVNSNQAEVNLRFSSVGIHRIHCAYTVSVKPYSYKSEKSNTISVSVTELSIKPILEILPHYNIYEGDQLDISCTVSNFMNNTLLDLTHGLRILARGTTKINYSMIALAKDPGEFECILEIANVKKVAKKTISVTELFSVPTLTVSPAEVFQKEQMTLTCKSENLASERLGKEELIYTLYPNNTSLNRQVPGVFVGKAPQTDFNYTCVAQAKGIIKRSETLTVRPKVAVSTPKILVAGRAVLGQPFKIHCLSDTGTLPINYTLLKDDKPLRTFSVEQHFQQALFSATIFRPDEISKYKCEAKNSPREPLRSNPLNSSVVVPLSTPVLNIIPSSAEISEGDNLILICGTTGTPPVTFRWYHEGNDRPLQTIISNKNNTSYEIPMLSKMHSGRYYCEAVNHANNIVRSNWVNIEVRLALWKKVLIGGSCLLAVSLLAVACVLYFKSRRVKVDRAVVSVWSKRPPEDANDEENSVVSSEPDVEYTEVVHPRPADPARVPLRKGTDTVYSELQNSPHDAADHHDYGSVEYADLNGEQPEINHYHPEVNNYQDLPEPVD